MPLFVPLFFAGASLLSIMRFCCGGYVWMFLWPTPQSTSACDPRDDPPSSLAPSLAGMMIKFVVASGMGCETKVSSDHFLWRMGHQLP